MRKRREPIKFVTAPIFPAAISIALIVLAMGFYATLPAAAEEGEDEWGEAKPDPALVLKPIKVVPKAKPKPTVSNPQKDAFLRECALNQKFDFCLENANNLYK